MTVYMPFGRHRGDPIEDLPTDYIEWALRETELHPTVQEEMEAQLRARNGEGIARGRRRE